MTKAAFLNFLNKLQQMLLSISRFCFSAVFYYLCRLFKKEKGLNDEKTYCYMLYGGDYRPPVIL